jgi:hypothetical protein
MSDVWRWRAAVASCAAVLALGASPVARAQSLPARPVAERFAESQHRLDAISRLIDSVNAAADSAAPPLAMVEGLVHLRYDSSLGPLTLAVLRKAARQASTRVSAVQGDAAVTTVGGAQFVAFERTNPWSHRRQLELHVRGAGSQLPFFVSLPVSPPKVADYLAQTAANIATNRLMAGLDHSRLGTVPVAQPATDGWTDLAIWTATATSTVARRCAVGQLADCRRLLETPTSTARLEDWYDPADYPALVERRDWRKDSEERQEIARRCVEMHDAGACSDAAHHMLLPYPVPIDAMHESLTALALEKGGPQALARMFAAPVDDIARVEAAAVMPMDSLVAQWQRRVAAARPTHGVLGELIALLWFATLLFVLSRRRPTCA